MTVKIDFKHDAAKRCLERLTEAGYGLPQMTDEDAIRTYISIRHRRVRARPRTLHKANYVVPPHLAIGEGQLLAKVEAGHDLWPHQSRKIEAAGKEDGMLNDFGIQHFHLGIAPQPNRPNLIQGTKELLYAVVQENDFYAIGIYDHDDWSRKELIDIVHETWPNLTEPFTFKGGGGIEPIGLAHHCTDEEASKLRAARINVIQQRPDGKIQMGMGGGIAADRSSVRVTLETNRFIRHIEVLQKEVEDTVASSVTSQVLPADAKIYIEWNGDNVLLVSEPPAVDVNLTGLLAIPAL